MTVNDTKQVSKEVKKKKRLPKHKRRKSKKEKELSNTITDEDGNVLNNSNTKIARDFSSDLHNYLVLWRERDNGVWKFNKVLQAWALDNCFDKKKIESKLFKDLLPYIVTIQGNALNRLKEKAQQLIDGYDYSNETIKNEDDNDDDNNNNNNVEKTSSNPSMINRAVKIYNILHEIIGK